MCFALEVDVDLATHVDGDALDRASGEVPWPLAEMSYEFDAPFVLDTNKYQTTFGTNVTPLEEAIAATVAWYRTKRSSS